MNNEDSALDIEECAGRLQVKPYIVTNVLFCHFSFSSLFLSVVFLHENMYSIYSRILMYHPMYRLYIYIYVCMYILSILKNPSDTLNIFNVN